jgi:hypothetical protein
MCRWLARDCPRPASGEGRRRERSIYRYECCRSQRMAIAPQIGGR